jgi:RNA polymerase sigma factor (TIGR02999 family)
MPCALGLGQASIGHETVAPLRDTPVTQLLMEWRGGREGALEELTPLVHAELHRIARAYMRRENAGHTLQPTAVVNEAYIKLVDAEVNWKDRVHFRAVAAQTMRRILVDHARSKHREKRGGAATLVTLNEEIDSPAGSAIDVAELDLALRKLLEIDERKGRIIELHYFGGLTYDELAEALDVSAATVDRDLRLAKAWLHRELSGSVAP